MYMRPENPHFQNPNCCGKTAKEDLYCMDCFDLQFNSIHQRNVCAEFGVTKSKIANTLIIIMLTIISTLLKFEQTIFGLRGPQKDFLK